MSPSSASGLLWSPPRLPVRRLVDAAPAAAAPDLGWFAQALKRAEVLDATPVKLPGAVVMHPYGVHLARGLETLVRQTFTALGCEEYEYPELAPHDIYEPSASVTDLDGGLFGVGADADWAKGQPYAVLTPTGEATVYTDWRARVRSRADLPIRMFRQARYFRPTARGRRSGRSIFRPAEAAGVYEFQSCFASRTEALAEMRDMAGAVRDVAAACHVPMFWSARPPWTNRGEIALQAYGGDVPLPSGGTVQVACLYDQGQRFSEAYGIGWRAEGEKHFTQHVTGCVSRRLLLCHLFLGMDADGNLAVHPDLAPAQVAMTSSGCGEKAEQVFRLLAAAGIRVERLVDGDRRAVNRFHDKWRRRGAPIRGYLQGPRQPGDRIRLVIVRADTRAEVALCADSVDGYAEALTSALSEVGVGLADAFAAFARRRQLPANAETLAQVLADRMIATVPLCRNAEAVRALEGRISGEVLGFRAAQAPEPCVVTGQLTESAAYVSARV